jgi:cobalt-zinc-cadmium efflux system membrane fusion protein
MRPVLGATLSCGIALAAALALPTGAQAAPVARGAAAPKPLGCLIEPDRIAEVGSQVVGLVERLNVERGDLVKSGQPLLSLRADVERANASAAETRSRIDAEVLAAKASLELALQKVQRAEALVAQNFVSDQAVEQARGEAEVARQKLNQVHGQQRVWVEERRVAEAQLALRTVRSPFAGVVTERYVNLGERVEDRPLLRVAVIDPLRVELMVPTAQYGVLNTGDRVTIRPELPGVNAVVATVRHVDRVFDAASNSFRVRLSLPNPGYKLPAGLRCKADLPFDAAAAAAPAHAPRLAPTVERQRSPVPPRNQL